MTGKCQNQSGVSTAALQLLCASIDEISWCRWRVWLCPLAAVRAQREWPKEWNSCFLCFFSVCVLLGFSIITESEAGLCAGSMIDFQLAPCNGLKANRAGFWLSLIFLKARKKKLSLEQNIPAAFPSKAMLRFHWEHPRRKQDFEPCLYQELGFYDFWGYVNGQVEVCLFIFLFDPSAKSHNANLKHFALTTELEERNIMF